MLPAACQHGQRLGHRVTRGTQLIRILLPPGTHRRLHQVVRHRSAHLRQHQRVRPIRLRFRTQHFGEALATLGVDPRQRQPVGQQVLQQQVVGPGGLVHHPRNAGAHPGGEGANAFPGVREPGLASTGEFARVQVVLGNVDADRAEIRAVFVVFTSCGMLLHAFQSPILVLRF